jgi:hypothetical protein
MTACSSLRRVCERVSSVAHAWFVREGLALSASLLPEAQQEAMLYKNFCLSLRSSRVLILNC